MSQVNISVKDFVDLHTEIIGYSVDSDCSLNVVNRARMIAYPLGDWDGTLSYELIPVYSGGRIILPSHLESIKDARTYGGRVDINNHNLFIDKAVFTCCEPCSVIKLPGRSYIPFQLTENAPLYFRPANSKDLGKKITIKYSDTRGSFREEEIILSEEPSRLTNYPHEIISLVKERTIGSVEVMSSGTFAKGCGYVSATIAGQETNPSYSIYCTNITCGHIAVEAKKKYRPYTQDDLHIPLDIHPEALSSFIIAIKAKDSREPNWTQEYSQAVNLALNFLKKEQADSIATNTGIRSVEYKNHFFDSLSDPIQLS